MFKTRLAQSKTQIIGIAALLATAMFASTFAFGYAEAAEGALEAAPASALNAQNVTYLPDVTEEMTKPSYWSSKQDKPNAILANRAAIDKLNQAGIDGDGTMLQPLKDAREYYYSADQQITLKNGAQDEMAQLFIDQAEDENGNILTQADADEILANYPTDGTTPDIASQYAIVTTHTTMRCYPTDRMLGLTAGDRDDDNLYLSALRVNEPLIVRAQSVDKNFLLCISSCMSVAWVPTKDVAICKDKAEWLAAWDIPQGHELVVTGYKVRTEQTRVTPNTANRMLYMGTVLESVDLESPRQAFELVGTRSAYYNHVCYLPVRNEDGTYSKEMALIATSAQVREGFLPLTKTNIAEVAFNSLGQMYGWGGMLESNDCSGYVRDVYKCFGLELARNTTWQMNLPVRKYDLTSLSDTQKAAAIAQMPLGTVLFWASHEMIYLGQENGKLYVISSLGSIGDIYGDSSGLSQVKSVSINALDIVRGNGTTWLTNLTTANIPYISNDEQGVDLFDIAFYEGATTWPAKSYKPTGKAITPKVTIEGLKAGTDYQVSYKANVRPGVATVVVSGKGAYTGSMSKTFRVEKYTQSISAKTSVAKTYRANSQTKAIADKKIVSLKPNAKISAKTATRFAKTNKAGGTKIVVNATTGVVTLQKGLAKGTYSVKIKVTAPANATYQAAPAKTITLKIIVK